MNTAALLILAELQRADFGDWVQFLIVALFVVGSVLGPLIKKLTGENQEEEVEESLSPEDGGWIEVEPNIPKRRPGPPLPKARPMPPGRGKPVNTAPPFARPLPSESEAPPVVVPPVAPSVFGAPPKPRPRPRPPLVEAPPVVARPSPAAPKTVSKSRKPPRKARRPKSTAADRGLRSTVADGEDRAFERRAKKLGDLHLEQVAAIDDTGIADELKEVLHPTRESLRRAVLMSEILGPPLALRPPSSGGGMQHLH